MLVEAEKNILRQAYRINPDIQHPRIENEH